VIIPLIKNPAAEFDVWARVKIWTKDTTFKMSHWAEIPYIFETETQTPATDIQEDCWLKSVSAAADKVVQGNNGGAGITWKVDTTFPATLSLATTDYIMWVWPEEINTGTTLEFEGGTANIVFRDPTRKYIITKPGAAKAVSTAHEWNFTKWSNPMAYDATKTNNELIAYMFPKLKNAQRFVFD
jgi:hypothetical protein